jgi:hypothetical protein
VACAGFVPGYSGGTVPVLHRLPYYALYGHPNYLYHYIYDFFQPVKENLRLEKNGTLTNLYTIKYGQTPDRSYLARFDNYPLTREKSRFDLNIRPG